MFETSFVTNQPNGINKLELIFGLNTFWEGGSIRPYSPAQLWELNAAAVRRDQRQACRSQQPGSQLDLARWEGLILHDHSAAAGQNHDVEVLLFLMGVLVPVPHHLRVVRGDEGHLEETEHHIETKEPNNKSSNIEPKLL